MERRQRIGLVLAAVVVAVGAFVLLRPSDDGDGESTSARTETQVTRPREPVATVPAPKPQSDMVRILSGQPEGGVREIRVVKGEVVRLTVRSDEPGEVHVHGYDLMQEVGAGGSVRFRFKADIEGVFEVELEDTHTAIAKLVVEP